MNKLFFLCRRRPDITHEAYVQRLRDDHVPFIFFFQAEDGIRDIGVTRVQTCALPIWVKFLAGLPPPPTIMDEVQLGDDLVREGYRLACQCVLHEAVTVQPAPPLDERSFQILGAGPGVRQFGRVLLDSGIAKQVVKVAVPREEHHQTSDLEQLLAAVGLTTADVVPAVLQRLPSALRDDPTGVTVTTFAEGGASAGESTGRQRILAVERGDTALMKFGLAIDVGTTSVVTTLVELESGEQLASVSSLNPQTVFGGDLMSRIAFAQF